MSNTPTIEELQLMIDELVREGKIILSHYNENGEAVYVHKDYVTAH